MTRRYSIPLALSLLTLSSLFALATTTAADGVRQLQFSDADRDPFERPYPIVEDDASPPEPTPVARPVTIATLRLGAIISRSANPRAMLYTTEGGPAELVGIGDTIGTDPAATVVDIQPERVLLSFSVLGAEPTLIELNLRPQGAPIVASFEAY